MGLQPMTAREHRQAIGFGALFGDGSVKFIKDSVAMATWWALGTKANGETVSQGDY